jgi:hypothetical protein
MIQRPQTTMIRRTIAKFWRPPFSPRSGPAGNRLLDGSLLSLPTPNARGGLSVPSPPGTKASRTSGFPLLSLAGHPECVRDCLLRPHPPSLHPKPAHLPITPPTPRTGITRLLVSHQQSHSAYPLHPIPTNSPKPPNRTRSVSLCVLTFGQIYTSNLHSYPLTPWPITRWTLRSWNN